MADTSKTRDQLIHRALKNIGIIEAGESPAAEDYASVDDLVDPLIATLAADEVYYLGDTDEIPLDVYLPLSRLLGNAAGPDFGYPFNEDAKRMDEAILRRLSSTEPTLETLKVKSY